MVPIACRGQLSCSLLARDSRVRLRPEGEAALNRSGGSIVAMGCGGHRTGQIEPKYTLPKHKLTTAQKEEGL